MFMELSFPANGPGLTVIPMFEDDVFEHPLASVTFTILKFVEFGGHMLIGRFVALSLPEEFRTTLTILGSAYVRLNGAEPVRLKIKSKHSPAHITVELELILEVGAEFTLTVIVDVTGAQAPVGSVTV